jgi:hypothetical protein
MVKWPWLENWPNMYTVEYYVAIKNKDDPWTAME